MERPAKLNTTQEEKKGKSEEGNEGERRRLRGAATRKQGELALLCAWREKGARRSFYVEHMCREHVSRAVARRPMGSSVFLSVALSCS